MQFPSFISPDFSGEPFASAPDVKTEPAGDGFLPENFYATTIYPEYVKIGGKWTMLHKSRMDCAVVIRDGVPFVTEPRRVKQGDMVVVGRKDDASEGVYVHADCFAVPGKEENAAFAFRTGQSRETSMSREYDRLFEILRHDRENGYIIWVLGPACVFDNNSRNAMASLIKKGYCNCLFAGNALATHDLEAALFHTGLGQDIYTKEQAENGHYNHLHTINLVRKAGSVGRFLEQYGLDNGVMHALTATKTPFVLAGSIRDDGPLPEVIGNAYDAQNAMREHTRRATCVICLATQLHTIATGNMTPSYCETDEGIRPVYFYSVDISEFAVNKLHDRGSLAVKGMVTNIQDFLVNLDRNL
jgi:lysine-ketoglutarate reductase/saccharopine dehydrogenase-like protein (TIGR00300 family)